MIEPGTSNVRRTHFSQSVIAANSTIPRKFRDVFSYRVATRRNCFNRLMHRSTLFRSLSTTTSYSRGVFRFDRGGITTSAPRASTASANGAADAAGRRGRFYAFAGEHVSGTRPGSYHFCAGCHTGHTFATPAPERLK